MKGKTMHDKIINKYTKAVDYIKSPKDMTGRVFRKAIKQTNIKIVSNTVTKNSYYKYNSLSKKSSICWAFCCFVSVKSATVV